MLVDEAYQTVDPKWAWAPYRPDVQRPWDLRRVGHLFRRATFGASWDEIQTALADGPERAIDKLLEPDADVAAANRRHDEFEASTDSGESADAFRSWWLRRMIETPHPLLEKMTLFWHNHFAISNARVNSSLLMRKHIALLRGHALGRYQPLLETVSQDPAVLSGLDSIANRKSDPNENYARGLMGAFALGLNNFSETDVREAARAFTGWFVLRNEVRYLAREHDSGMMTVLGQKGNFTDKDVVRIVLEQPAAPRFLVRKLYRWLVAETEEPSDALIEPLAVSFGRDYDLGKLVETILRSNLFFSSVAYRRKVKSPVEFALGIVKGFEGLIPTARLGQDLADLGQNLLHPPTINGWVGGSCWINEATVLGRNNLALQLLSGEKKPYGDRLNPLAVAQKHGFAEPTEARRFLLDLLVQDDLPPHVVEALGERTSTPAGSADSDLSAKLRRYVQSIATLPEFQLN